MLMRGLTLVFLVTGLLTAAVFGPRWIIHSSSEEDTGNVRCDLLKAPCHWSGESGVWQVSLEPLETQGSVERLQLSVRAPVQANRVTALLRGESMYLGEYPLPLSPVAEPGVWQTRFEVPVCAVEPNMTWRLELLVPEVRGGKSPVMVFRVQ